MEEIFRERLLKLISKKKMSQAAFGRLIGQSKQNVNNWTTGISKPHIKELIKISEALQVSIDYLLGNENTYEIIEDDTKITIAKEEYVEYLSLKKEKIMKEMDDKKK
jgi:transcriptional regulator with XRE-family HTH domain